MRILYRIFCRNVVYMFLCIDIYLFIFFVSAIFDVIMFFQSLDVFVLLLTFQISL